MNVFRVWLSGDVDTSRAQALTGVVQDFRAGGCSHVVVDLTDVSTMDVCGVSMLLALGDVAEGRGGSVTLLGPPRSCLRWLEQSNKAPSFEVHVRGVSPERSLAAT